MRVHAGVDVGGTKTHAVLLDNADAVLGESILPTGRGDDAVLSTIRSSIEHAAAGLDGTVATIGVGIPGIIDPRHGTVRNAVNLGVESLALGDELTAYFGAPVLIDNDVRAAARGAVVHFDALGTSLAYLNVGTGVAASVFTSGDLWSGGTGVAGEIGHLPVDQHGALCGCGQRGCLETVAGGARLAARWIESAPGASMADFDVAVDAADPVAASLFADLVFGVVTAVKTLALAYDTELIVLGGGVIANRPALVRALTERLDADARCSAFIRSLGIPSRLRIAPAGVPLAPLGAAIAARTSAMLDVDTTRRS